MAAYLGNPALIYEGPDWVPEPRAPLILIHDGGGTTFSYHCLDPTDRPLYGVENAHLHEGGWWDGGIPEMARHYIELIGKALPKGGEIVLGGWSLGGVLSLEMAHQIATDKSLRPKFTVLGIVMVDSMVAPRTGVPGTEHQKQLGRVTDRTPEQIRALDLKAKVDVNMTHARRMVARWELPRWERGARPPPTILLRARDAVDGPTPSFADFARGDRMLGWGPYNEENGRFIRSVVDIQGHHFSVFKDDYIEDVTAKICAAATKLEDDFY
ncbi:Alpha/Beta hydrolase protein [Pestalotiopsis sp. NC0098]|nr:Alpha/Beta hydrolase protein [Pestalotiopsis sp. NC0098]